MSDSPDKDSVSIHIGGDVDGSQIVAAGRDVTIGSQQFNVKHEQITNAFAEIYRQIEERPPDPDVDKPEIQSTVENIEAEVKSAGCGSLRRWHRTFLMLLRQP
jgi:hypothetical protein